MFDSKRSRGLALSAVSALTITGLTCTPSPALAEPGDTVVMLSQLDGKASIRRNGSSSGTTKTVSLVAERRDPTATISFEVNANPAAGDDTEGWTAIDSTPTLTGNFAKVSWNALAFVGTTVSLRAVATTTADEPTYSTVTGVAVTGDPLPGATAPNSVTVQGAGFAKGYFRQPYASSGHTATQIVVAGTSTAGEGTVDLDWWRSSDGTFQGNIDAALTPISFKISPTSSYDIGTFSEVMDITGYDAEAADDVLVVRGVRDSDDVTPFAVYDQSVGLADATTPTDGYSHHPTVDILVRDTTEMHAAVIGAEVRRLSDESLVGYTDQYGGVATPQDADTTETYYVNTTDTDAYEDGLDIITAEVTTPEFTPTVSDVVPVLADGTYFDDDEYDEGDIALQLVDQDGEPIAAAEEQVTYSLHDKGTTAPEPTTATTDAEGRVVIPFDPAGPDDEHVLDYAAPVRLGVEPHDPIEFVSGDSTLTLTPDTADGIAASGGQITYTGNLDLDGVPLADRRIDLTYLRGAEASPGTVADAGIVVGDARLLSTTVTTDDDGEFTVTVADPAEAGRPGETGGTLTATAPAAEETASVTTTFTAGPAAPTQPPAAPPTAPAAAPTVKLKLTGSNNGRAADQLTLTGTGAAAGRRVLIYARLGLGHWQLVGTKRLDRSGQADLTMADRNGTKATRYRVKLPASASVPAATSNVKHLR